MAQNISYKYYAFCEKTRILSCTIHLRLMHLKITHVPHQNWISMQCIRRIESESNRSVSKLDLILQCQRNQDLPLRLLFACNVSYRLNRILYCTIQMDKILQIVLDGLKFCNVIDNGIQF
jgi:hypothetical protein